jgi:hypothetical protein
VVAVEVRVLPALVVELDVHVLVAPPNVNASQSVMSKVSVAPMFCCGADVHGRLEGSTLLHTHAVAIRDEVGPASLWVKYDWCPS